MQSLTASLFSQTIQRGRAGEKNVEKQGKREGKGEEEEKREETGGKMSKQEGGKEKGT